MSKDGPAIVIEAISYSPVAAKRNEDDFWAECVAQDEIEEPVRVRFHGYLKRCYEGKEKDFGEVTFVTSDGKALQTRLNKIRKLALDKENKERRETTQELSDRLSQKMASKGGALAGAIFVVQGLINKTQYVALLKLDLGRAEVVALKNAKVDRHLISEVFERALPMDASNFRKGILLPSTGDGDARSGQHDAFSEYWQEFIGDKPFREAQKATTSILHTAMTAMRGEGKPLPAKTASAIMDKVSKVRERDIEKIARIIKEETGVRKAPSALQDELEKNLGSAPLSDLAPLDRHVFEFSRGLRFSVPAEEIAKERVIVKADGNDVLIRIKDSKLKSKQTIGRPE